MGLKPTHPFPPLPRHTSYEPKSDDEKESLLDHYAKVCLLERRPSSF